MPPFSSLTHFIGMQNELPETGNTGDICLVNDIIYIYSGGWNELAISPSISINVETPDCVYFDGTYLIFDN